MRRAEADGDIVEIIVRKARPEDREKAIEVESKATPNLSYVGVVFDTFVSDEVGEFSVAEVDGEVVAIGKFTVVPDGSAWLETLRVIPERQGHGIGKRFYDRFYEVAESRDVPTMRMYTGVKNVVSKGLAERYGFHQAQTFRGARMPPAQRKQGSPGTFTRVTDPDRATELLMSYCDAWGGYLVMNRTFYTLTPALCAYLAEEGMVYEDPESGSVMAMGARFMPEKELHIGLFGGDANTCLEFAAQEGEERGVDRLSCLFPASATVIQGFLMRYGFQLLPSDFIVMEAHLEK